MYADTTVVATYVSPPLCEPTPARITTQSQTKKAKQPVDPNAPKRACSAFLLFSKAERAHVKSEYPDATQTEMCKHLGDRWKAADEETKAKYAALYMENKVKATEARRVYADTMVDATCASPPLCEPTPARITTQSQTKKAKPPVDPNAPKRAC